MYARARHLPGPSNTWVETEPKTRRPFLLGATAGGAASTERRDSPQLCHIGQSSCKRHNGAYRSDQRAARGGAGAESPPFSRDTGASLGARRLVTRCAAARLMRRYRRHRHCPPGRAVRCRGRVKKRRPTRPPHATGRGRRTRTRRRTGWLVWTETDGLLCTCNKNGSIGPFRTLFSIQTLCTRMPE